MKKSITLKYSDFPQPEEREDPNKQILDVINMGLRINPTMSAHKFNMSIQALDQRLRRLEGKGLLLSKRITMRAKDGRLMTGRIYEKINHDSNNRNKPPRTKRN